MVAKSAHGKPHRLSPEASKTMACALLGQLFHLLSLALAQRLRSCLLRSAWGLEWSSDRRITSRPCRIHSKTLSTAALGKQYLEVKAVPNVSVSVLNAFSTRFLNQYNSSSLGQPSQVNPAVLLSCGRWRAGPPWCASTEGCPHWCRTPASTPHLSRRPLPRKASRVPLPAKQMTQPLPLRG